MIRALYTAASGMNAQQMNLDAIANNLANSSTAGFQQRRVQFADLLYQNQIAPGSAASQQTTVADGLQVGLGSRPVATEILQTQGNLSQTGNPLDLAISGQGFFQILLPNGQTGYTRSGSFQADAQGNVVTPERRSAAARHHRTARRYSSHRRRGRNRICDAAGPDAGAAGRLNSARSVCQSGRPKQRRQQHLHANYGFGRPNSRRSRRG